MAQERAGFGRALKVIVVAGAWAAIVAVSLGHVIALVQGASGGDATRIGLDYRAFIAAGELVRSGDGQLLYEPMSEAFARLAEVEFLYPPWAAFVFVPWSLLDFEVGLVLWTLLGVVGMMLAMWWLGIRSVGFLVASLVVFPSVFALGLGQSAHHLVAMTALAYGLIARNRWSASGVAVALSAWKPHLMGGWAILAVAGFPKWNRWIRAAVVTTIALFVVSALALPGSWRSWFGLLTGDADGFASPSLEVSFPGMISLLIGTTVSSPVLEVAMVASAFTAGVLVLRRYRGPFAAAFGFALALWLLFVPHLVVYGVLVLAVPLGVMIMDSRFRDDVVVVGTTFAFCVSIGPAVVEAQLDAFEVALDPSTIGLLIAAGAFAAWTIRGRPFLDGPSRSEAPTARTAHAGER